jgi:hypothetical protein
MPEVQTVKMRAGKYLKPVERWEQDGRLFFKWKGYQTALTDEIRSMEGARFDWDAKIWSIEQTQRNKFQLEWLYGGDPYASYDKPLVPFEPRRRELYKHQIDIARHVLTYHQAIIAAEMGTGKTLALIEAMEAVGREDVLWVGPRSALAAVELEFYKWRSRILPIFMTYEKVKALVENWPEDYKAPFFVVADESSKVKTATSQRSAAMQHLADAVRRDWGGQGFVVLMSGSPAPKSPADWWKQAEIACPGFLKEGNAEKFKRRLGLIVDKPSLSGGNYPHLVTWLDDKRKCAKCGMLPDHPNHDVTQALFSQTTSDFHPWRESENEVERLYRRMKGLTLVLFKKDCIDLPDKIFREIQCTPTPEVLRAAKLIQAGAKSAITALIQLRELSDGFQYQDEVVGQDVCPRCEGKGECLEPVFTGHGFEDTPEAVEIWDSEEIPEDEKIKRLMEMGVGFEMVMGTCQQCDGAGEIDRTQRHAAMVDCPKDDRLIDILDTHDDDGRLVTYGGFTGTIDRVVGVTTKVKWNYIRVDGRGWSCSWGAKKPQEMLSEFQDKHSRIEKINFIGHPGSAGMGLTLTRSSETVFYSNDFNGESRIQAVDRIHRPGMDVNKGATITDLLHLPTDKLVLESHKRKQKLMNMTLGQFRDAMKAIETNPLLERVT